MSHGLGYGLGPINCILGVIYVNDKNINLEMVRAGLAIAYREDYLKDLI